jgi:hypothetical protein
MLLLGALAGYAFRGSTVQAQSEGLPFAIGDTVTFWYGNAAASPDAGTAVECAVAEIRGSYVKCGTRTRIRGGIEPTERWFALTYVVQITKRER